MGALLFFCVCLIYFRYRWKFLEFHQAGSPLLLPLYIKKGSKLQVSNYRPVSVTSCCSRILERIINMKIKNYLEINNLLFGLQHGFTSGRSTDTALITFYDYLTSCLDQGLTVHSIFFDFQKAFDSVPHNMLVNAAPRYRYSGVSLEVVNRFLV